MIYNARLVALGINSPPDWRDNLTSADATYILLVHIFHSVCATDFKILFLIAVLISMIIQIFQLFYANAIKNNDLFRKTQGYDLSRKNSK